MPDEPDVRFLLVHHTVSPNDYDEAGAVDLLRGIHAFHTGQKGWPDIAYNFFVDRFGTVYEGRLGSLDGAKAVDATGGSQGFAQLGCFLGDHQVEPPSEAAVASMQELLAWLADRHGLDISHGTTVTFTSRGSNRWPAGSEVTTPTIAGHRDMSRTACPGDAAYALVLDGTFARAAAAQPESTTTATTAAPATSATTAAPPSDAAAPPPAPAAEGSDGDDMRLPIAATAVLALAAAAIALRRRRRA